MSESSEELEELIVKKREALEFLSQYKNRRFASLREDIEAIDFTLPLEDGQKILLKRIAWLAGYKKEYRDSRE